MSKADNRIFQRGELEVFDGAQISSFSTDDNIKPGMAVKRNRALVAGTDYLLGVVPVPTGEADTQEELAIAIEKPSVGSGVDYEYEVVATSAAELRQNPKVFYKYPQIGDKFQILVKSGHAAFNEGSEFQFDDASRGYFEAGTAGVAGKVIVLEGSANSLTEDTLVLAQRVA